MKILLMKSMDDVYYVVQPSLGLGIVASIMEKCGHQVRILDPTREKLTWDEFINLIRRERYDLVGIQVFAHNIASLKKQIDVIKDYSPFSTIICGGGHVSGDPEGTMSLLERVDFGFAGEAEIGLESFLGLKKEDYADHSLLRTVPNLVWRLNNEVVINERKFSESLDEVKFPAWHLMSLSSYPNLPHGTFCKRRPVAPIITSRGCPFRCTFCAAKAISGQKVRYRNIKNVIDEILLLKNNYGIEEFHIEDDNFTFKKEYVIDFCNEILSYKINSSFALPNGVRLETLDKEILVLMEKAGFYSMAVGIESGCDRILKLMKKDLSKKFIKEKVDLIKNSSNFNLTGLFLIGYPGETEEEILETIDFAKKLRLDKASFMFVIPLPGSDLWKIYKDKGSAKFDWENFFSYKVVEGVSEIPVRKLKSLYKKAMLGFYLRPKIILGLIKEIGTYSQVKILIKRLQGILAPVFGFK